MSGISVRVHGAHVSKFPALTGDKPTMLIIVEDADEAGLTADLHTNLGASMSTPDALLAIGSALHEVSHALLGGVAVDLSDLDKPISSAATGGDEL